MLRNPTNVPIQIDDLKENKYDKLLKENLPTEGSKKFSIRDNKIVFEGIIETGDSIFFEQLLKNLGPSYNEIILMSPGGNVDESMKIGRLIRKLRMNTSVPAIPLESGTKCIPEPKDEANCQCSSSCFFIYISGVYRHALTLGIHRIYVNHQILNKLSGAQAIEAAHVQRNIVREYLEEMGIPETYNEIIFKTPSDSLVWIRDPEINELNGDIMEIQEWISAKCAKEKKFDDRFTLIHKKVTNNIATREERNLLEKNPQFYLKLSACRLSAKKELYEEAWREHFSN